MQKYTYLRDWAKRYMEIAASPRQQELSDLWEKHNSLEDTRPLYFIRRIPYHEFFDFSIIKSEEDYLRNIEIMLATSVLFRSRLEDDFVFKPWVTLDAVLQTPPEDRWGVPCSLGEKTAEGGAAAFDPQILCEEDLNKIKIAPYQINEEETARRTEQLYDIFGDTIGIYVNKRGAYAREWNMDISTDLAKLIGLENLLWYLYDEPEFLHKLLRLMQKAILSDIDQVEASGNNCLADCTNQSIPFVKGLPHPDCNVVGCRTKELWGFFASQEFTMVGPDLFWEFMLQYQIPIMEKFGMVAYGCCEDLTYKIDLLRRVPNLRRIAVTPFANVPRCAEQIGRRYVLSWRPNPSAMIAHNLDETYVRSEIRKNFSYFRENHNIFDLTLKDVETIHHSPKDLIAWSRIVREEIESY